MESKELAQKMLMWGNLQEQAAILEKEISEAVLEIGKTQTVGNVRATFSNPRKTYQSWEDAVLTYFEREEVAEKFTVTPEPYIDWNSAGKEWNVSRESWVAENAKPSVKVKMI